MKNGDTLVGTDVGAVDVVDGRVGTLLTWTNGTGDFGAAFGHIVINGRADFITGAVVTDYRGEVCTP